MKIARFDFSKVYYGWWITWAYVLSFSFAGGAFIYGTPTIINPVKEELGWSIGAISLAFSLQRVQNGLLGPIVGPIVDKIGARIPIIIGTTLMSAGFVLLGLTQELWMFYVGFLLTATGLSFQSPSIGFVAINHWFKRNRSRALSVIAAAGGFSGILLPLITFLVTSLGWRHALFVMAGGFWLFAIPIVIIVKPRPEPYGYQVDGGPAPATNKPVPAPLFEEREYTLKEALRTRSYWCLALSMALIQVTITPLVSLAFPALEDKGFSTNFVGWIILSFTLISVCARFGIGFIADHVDKRYLLCGSAALQVIGVIFFITAGSAWALIPFIIFFGIGYGGTLPLRAAMQVEYYGKNSFGAINGFILLVIMPAAVISPAVVGFLHDKRGSYTLGFVILCIVTLLSIPLVLLSKPKRVARAVVPARAEGGAG